jgi:protein-disulfide isomerase
MRVLAPLWLSCALLAQAPAPPKKSFLDKPTLEAYIRHLYAWPAEVKVAITDPRPASVEGMVEVTVTGALGTASQSATFFVTRNGESVVQGSAYNVNQNPFRETLANLKTASAPAIGTPGAPVVVAVFSDFQCPYCRDEAKMLRANLVQTFSKEVRLYFKDFPLEQIHPWAKPAAIAGRCIYREDQAKFWEYHDWVFEQQQQLTADNFRNRLGAFLKEKKFPDEAVLKCLDDKAAEAEVNKIVAEGRLLDVNSTPTLFVNGRKLAGNISWPQLKQIIEIEVEYQKTAKNAGEDCGCQLTLPASPLNK